MRTVETFHLAMLNAYAGQRGNGAWHHRLLLMSLVIFPPRSALALDLSKIKSGQVITSPSIQDFYPDNFWKQRATLCTERMLSARTYGEFTEFSEGLEFFRVIVEECRKLRGAKAPEDVFIDLGSGAGRVVLTAAHLWQWSKCCGIEISSTLHTFATNVNLGARCEPTFLKCSCEFICASFEEDPARHVLKNAGVVFAYSTAFPTDANGVLTWLAEDLMVVPSGCIVVTIDHPLILLEAEECVKSFVCVSRLFGRGAYGSKGLDATAYVYRRL